MATIIIKKDPNYREVPFGGNDGDILKKVGDNFTIIPSNFVNLKEELEKRL